MTALQKLDKPTMTQVSPSSSVVTSIVDLDGIDAFVRFALDDPRAAATDLAAWFDSVTTHHEGSDAARVLDNWDYAPSVDLLDALAWYVRQSKYPVRIRLAMMAVVTGALASMGVD